MATRRATRAATSLAGNLMLAPAVMALRLPLLASEAQTLNPWRGETARAMTEKSAAAVEGMIAAQTSLAISASRFWFELYLGRTPSLLSGAAFERAVHAALRPSAGAVRGNFRRLGGRRA